MPGALLWAEGYSLCPAWLQASISPIHATHRSPHRVMTAPWRGRRCQHPVWKEPAGAGRNSASCWPPPSHSERWTGPLTQTLGLTPSHSSYELHLSYGDSHSTHSVAGPPIRPLDCLQVLLMDRLPYPWPHRAAWTGLGMIPCLSCPHLRLSLPLCYCPAP